MKSAFFRVAPFGYTLPLGVHNSQTEEPAVHPDCDDATESRWVFDRKQRLIGINVLLGNHPAYKSSRAKPERCSRDSPKFEKGQFAKPLLRHG